MKYKFINADIVTMDDESPIIKGGSVAVEGGVITYCGKGQPEGNFDNIIDCKGDILMPPLFNCHTHLAMSLFRGAAENKSLDEWLFDYIFPLEEKLTEEDIYWGVMLSVAESVRGGVATLCDSYFFNHVTVLAADKSGVNMVLLGADMDIKQGVNTVIKKVEDDYNKYNGKKSNIRYIPGCHSVYTCSRELLEAIADFAAEKKCPTYIHLSETLKEVGECAEKNNDLTPPQYLHKMGYFDYGGIAAHCVYVDKDDIKLLGQSGVSPAVCSGSNLKLASGLPPVYSMVQNGLNVTLGSDGAASNNRLDIFREMYLAAVLQKGALNNPTAVTPCQALKMATVNAAKALQMKDRGMIKAGYSADIIRVSTGAPHFQPRADIMADLVYGAISSDVAMTMCGGKILYNSGEFNIGENIADISRNFNKSAKRLLQSI